MYMYNHLIVLASQGQRKDQQAWNQFHNEPDKNFFEYSHCNDVNRFGKALFLFHTFQERDKCIRYFRRGMFWPNG